MAKIDWEQDNIWTELQARSQIPFAWSRDGFFTHLKVSPVDLLLLMKALRRQLHMNYLADITSTDQGTEFEIIYHLYAIPDNGGKLAVRTRVPREAAQLDSLTQIYPTADWQEREIFDLMGIRFQGHPNLVRVLLPDDFVGHPLRKDFQKEVR